MARGRSHMCKISRKDNLWHNALSCNDILGIMGYITMALYLIVQVWVLGLGCCGVMQWGRPREDSGKEECEASVRILQEAVKG